MSRFLDAGLRISRPCANMGCDSRRQTERVIASTIAATDDPAVVDQAETVIVLVKAGDTVPAMATHPTLHTYRSDHTDVTKWHR